MDLRLDDDKDILFINGDCPVTNTEVDNVAQRLIIRLRTFLSEWYLNSTYGVPYEQILGQKIKKASADLIMQEQILGERGVVQITSFNSYVGTDRKYHCNFTVRTTQGGITSPIVI